MPEDCMFSSKVVKHSLNDFKETAFQQTICDMKNYGNPGYHIIANNLELNTNVTSYYHYSFQTLSYSSTGELLRQFQNLPTPRMFVYGDKNKGLSYLPMLATTDILLKMISQSDHFIFYDNPKALYEAIAEFVGPPL
jgi:thioredoxin-related protein